MKLRHDIKNSVNYPTSARNFKLHSIISNFAFETFQFLVHSIKILGNDVILSDRGRVLKLYLIFSRVIVDSRN